MKFVIQRVHKAAVNVRKNCIGSIDEGLVVLVGIGRGDTDQQMHWMVDKLLQLRIFSDEDGKMNLSVADVNGGLLIVPNFTLYADATQGNRPGFAAAEGPEQAREMYDAMIGYLKKTTPLKVETGEFGADMDVHLVNDGPVTIILER